MSEHILKLETIYDSQPAIRLEGFYKKDLPADYGLFIVEFLKNYNHKYKTIYATTRMTQTLVSKRRSLGDIYKITKYYYNNVDLKDLLMFLYNLCNTYKDMRSSYCSIINKRVFYYSLNRGKAFYSAKRSDSDSNICIDDVIREINKQTNS